jgi:uncharacterized cupin superfamily protein
MERGFGCSTGGLSPGEHCAQCQTLLKGARKHDQLRKTARPDCYRQHSVVRRRPGRAVRHALSRALGHAQGGRKIGIAYEELPPGKQSVPLHYHLLEEEHLIALEGEATLRLGEERHRIKAGDYVGFPAGQRAGHCLVNEGNAPFRYIVVGDHEPNDVCIYPDSNKVLVRKLDRAIFRDGQRLDYWDSERADEPVKRP